MISYLAFQLWTVRVPTDHVMRFRMIDYQLADDEILTVRDGRTSWPMTSQYTSVTTLSNVVIVQFVKSKIVYNLDSCGFIMTFEAIGKCNWSNIATVFIDAF